MPRRATTIALDLVLAGLLDGDGPGESHGGDDLNAAVLAATSALLSERGARGWTVEDVAVRAGVGRATLYRRFGDRDQLVAAAIRHDTRLFFAAVAESVASVEPFEEKVVAGFLTGLRLARGSPLGALIVGDPAAAWSMLSSGSLLEGASRALAERYEVLAGGCLARAERERAGVMAEALIRLGLSFLLLPGITGDTGQDRAYDHVARIIRPLLGGRS